MTRFAPVVFAPLAFFAAVATTTTPARAAEPRTHEGFQFRGVVGGGYLSTSESPDNITVNGGAIGFELYAGGFVIPGLSIGGFVGGAGAAGPNVTFNGQTSTAPNNVSLVLAYIGPYIDWYFDPKGGFHLQGMLELTRLAVGTGNGNVSTETPVGGGIGGGVGYDFWLGEAFSMGILGRINFSSNTYTPDGATTSVTDKTVNPMLFLSFTYH
jgi:hypothetical protein